MALEVSLQFVAAFSSVVVDHSVAPVGRQIGYLLKYKSNLETLKKHLQKLKDKKEKVQHSVDDAIRRGEEVETAVERWLSHVDRIIDDAEKIIAKGEEHARMGWFRRSCVNLKSRYQVGRKAAKERKTVTQLQEESRFGKISYRLPPRGVGITSVKGYEDFESRRRTMEGVTDALKDPNVNIIGIYGMGGIGKTTIAKEVANKVNQEGVYSVVVLVEVSQNQDYKKIQGEIADKLGLEFREETISGRADRLCDRLKKEKRILIILDNLWEKLDLEKVGIPSGESHKGCKILLTSRDHNVLSSEMEAEKCFPVGILTEKEAWDLFKKMAGDKVENPDFQSTAIEIAKECASFPLAIVTVAKALKNKSSSEWKNALAELRKPSLRNFTGIQAVIYSTIELSYKNLETEELKATFLLCGIIGNTIIMDLLKYGIGLGVFQDANTMEETRDRVNTLLCSLEASCLLVDRSTNDQFAIHDVVRDVALSIAARDKHVLTVKDAVGPKDWPYVDSTGIVLSHSDINELLEQMEYPKLKFLCIWNPSLELPDNLLTGMTGLRVLDFTEMRIPSLPSSILLLSNLRSLCLYSCVLQDIKIIGELKTLEILSFTDCDVEQFPKELGQLTQLQLLDLSDCSTLKVIPQGVISSLTKLEELYLGNSFRQWEVEEHNNQSSNARLAELRYLSHLTSLNIHIPNTQIMLKNLFSEKLDRYQIFIGDVWDWYGKYETDRTLKLKNGTSLLMEDGMYKLLKKTEDLYLDELMGEESILWKLDREGLPKLKHLHIQNSPDVKYIINSMDEPWISSKAFPILESVFLQNMINLEKICEGKLTSGSFRKLSIIKVGNCGRLENLFSFSMFRSFVQLQEIEVTDCKRMASIVAEERVISIVDRELAIEVKLVEFRSLMLKNLSSFISFCSNKELPSTSRNKSSVSMSLFDEKIQFPNLEELKLLSMKIAKIWPKEPQAMTCCIRNLKVLTVEGCAGLKYLFPSHIVKSLMQLKTLVIRDCEIIETVIEKEGDTNHMLFPELYDLRLENLPKLSGFCDANVIEFPSLRWLVIMKCHELKVFNLKTINALRSVSEQRSRTNTETITQGSIPLFDERLQLPNIERLIIDGLDKVERIWKDELAADAFSRIDYLSIWNCKRIKSIFPSNMMSRLQRIDDMSINQCSSLEMIFEQQGFIFRESSALSVTQQTEIEAVFRIVFPHITILKLWELPQLKNFYPGMHTTEWPLLKKLDLFGCYKLKLFSSKEAQRERRLDPSIQQPLFMIDEGTFPNLEELKIEKIDAMTETWFSQFPAASFRKLKVLELIGSLKQSRFSSLSFIQILPNLEKLLIDDGPLEEIFQYKVLGREETQLWRINRLTELKLSKLPGLEHLLKEEPLAGSILQDLRTVEVMVHGKLRKLVPSSITFQTLTILDLSKCHGLINLGTASAAKSLVQLTKLSITDCERIEEVIVHMLDDVKDEIVFTHLKHLGLYSLPRLASFCPGDCNFEFPSLEEVIVRGCPRMRLFSQGVVSTPKLQVVQLTEGEDKGCWNDDLNTTIKQLFAEMGGFLGLECLKLSEFPELVEIWNSSPVLSLDFKSLKLLEVTNCNNLSYLITASIAWSLVRLEELKIENCTMMKEVIRYESAEETAETKLTFPLLISISLLSLPNLTSFCSGMDTLEFPILENISIKNCPNMVKFASPFLRDSDSEISTNYENVESLGSRDAENPGALFEDKIAIPKLKEVIISHMDNLNHLWSKHISVASFSELKILNVQFCAQLLTIFPAIVVRALLRLEQVIIENCGVEYIVAKDEGETAPINFAFPSLTSLELKSLLDLKGFYPGKHTTDCPSLKRLDVFHCAQLLVFAPEFIFQEAYQNGQFDIPDDQQPLFVIEKVLPNLETFSLDEEDVAMISYSDPSVDLFRSAKFLLVQCYHVVSAVIPFHFLERLYNVEKLCLGCSYFQELIPDEELTGQPYNGIFTRVKNLRLDSLPSLTRIGNQGYQLESVLQNLETLEVWNCNGMISLTLFSSCFTNLKILDIMGCEGLLNLGTTVAVRRLVHLTEMRIRECNITREVVSNEGDGTEEEITFSKLKLIELDSLPSLSCFCAADKMLKFPSLEELIINKCPQFYIFSKGIVTTPLLCRVWLTKDWEKWRWEGDLNVTIHSAYRDILLQVGSSNHSHIQ